MDTDLTTKTLLSKVELIGEDENLAKAEEEVQELLDAIKALRTIRATTADEAIVFRLKQNIGKEAFDVWFGSILTLCAMYREASDSFVDKGEYVVENYMPMILKDL